MAARNGNGDAAGDGPGVGHNSRADSGKAFVARIESIEAEIERESKEFKDTVLAPLKSDVKSIYDEVEGAGLTKKSIKAVVNARKKRRQADLLRERLDIADRDTFDNIRLALGDLAELPLGLSAFGTPVALTDEEKANGVLGAWIDKDGTRSSLAASKRA